MTDYIQVLTTTAQQDEAQRIARALVERRLAACVQVVGPITSTYRWQGDIETSQEWLCIAKSCAQRYPEIEQAIRELHTYETPEILSVPILSGSKDYMAWLDVQISRDDSRSAD